MPTTETLQPVSENESWVNKPHSFDEVKEPVLIEKPPLPPRSPHIKLPSTTPPPLYIEVAPPHSSLPPPLPSRPLSKVAPAAAKNGKRASVSFITPNTKKNDHRYSKRKSFSVGKTLDYSIHYQEFVSRPKSMDFFIPPKVQQKPLPAVPIDPSTPASITPLTTTTATAAASAVTTPATPTPTSISVSKKRPSIVGLHQEWSKMEKAIMTPITATATPTAAIPTTPAMPTMPATATNTNNTTTTTTTTKTLYKSADFEPLTLKDITLILDRNDRMAAYDKAFEKCIKTPSPLPPVVKALKKKTPPEGRPPQRSSLSRQTPIPKRALTLPSLPSMISKKISSFP